MDLRGELAEGVLPGVLRSLYVERRTGLLHVTRGAERASLCFIGGNLVYGDTTVKEAQLGVTLVRHGLLSPWDLQQASEMVVMTGRRLGQVLLDQSVLDEARLEDALGLHVREVLLTIFCWRDGAYRFEEQEPGRFRGYDKPLKLSTGEVILDAAWSISDPDVVRYGLGDLDRTLSQSTDPLLRFQKVTLSSTDGFLFSRVDGVLTAREVLALVPGSAEEAERSLLGLLYTGMVEFLPPRARPAGPVPSRREQVIAAFVAMRRQNYYEALGVARDAKPTEVLAAYFRLAKLYHPDGHHEQGLETLKEQLEALFGRIAEAHRVLSNPTLRAAYDGSLAAARPGQPGGESEASSPSTPPPPERVTELIERAEEAAARGSFVEAAALAGEALSGAKGRQRRQARVVRAQALLQDPGGRKAAEEELRAALEEDPANAEAHYVLGTIYKAGAAATLAAASFRRALALRPRHAPAQAALEELEPRASDSRSDVIRKLFR